MSRRSALPRRASLLALGAAVLVALALPAGSVAARNQGSGASTGASRVAPPAVDPASAAAGLARLGSYGFKISLAGSFGREDPVRGSRVIASGLVVPGTGRTVRFTASGGAASPPLSYLERGRQAWIGAGGGAWLPVEPTDPAHPGSLASYFPQEFFGAVNAPWMGGLQLVRAESVRAVAANRYRVDPATLQALAIQKGFVHPEGWSLEVWLARSGGHLLRLEFRGVSGTPGAREPFAELLEIYPGAASAAALPNPR